MNIKSLLIGSAAALATVSGASAADAVVAAEPEPMEYVRVCDAYGAGYFYIPGTETCLKIGGWVRYEVHFNSSWPDPYDGFAKRARGRVEIQAKNESELGTVSSYIRLETARWSLTFDPVTGAPTSEDDSWAYDWQYSLGVGGLEMGYRDSQWNRFSGYGGLTDAGGSYGYQTRHYISYTFTGESFSAIVSLDHDDSNGYLPDVMAGVSGKFGNVAATLSAGFDTSDSSVAVKATLNAPIGPATLRLAGFYTSSATNAYWSAGASSWSIIAGIGAPLGQRASAALDFQYFEGGAWRVIGDVNYTIAPGLSALLEVQHRSTGTTMGMLRFQRSF